MSHTNLSFFAFMFLLGLGVASCNDSEQTTLPKDSDENADQVERTQAPEPYNSETVDTGGITKKYLVRSGMIEYQLSGVQTGTRTLYWDSWGLRQAIYEDTKTEVMGLSQSSKSKSINVGDKFYTIDLTTNTGVEMPNPAEGILKSVTDKEAEEMTDQMMKSLGGEKIGTDTIAGQTCDVWTVAIGETETCVWQNIPLRNAVSVAGMTNIETATNISVDIEVDAAHFAVPEGVSITKLNGAPDQAQ